MKSLRNYDHSHPRNWKLIQTKKILKLFVSVEVVGIIINIVIIIITYLLTPYLLHGAESFLRSYLVCS